MIKDTPKIQDQYTDRSGAVLTKIASNLASEEEFQHVVDTLYALPERMDKLATIATFPCDTLEDTLLSRVYFEGQKHLLKEAEAAEIDKRISVREALYGISAPQFAEEEPAEKTASVELLPGLSVSTPEELEKLGADFEQNYHQLSYEDRKSFATAYAKIAEELPTSISLYAGTNIQLRPDVAEQLHYRKVACDMAGKDGSAYMKLAEMLEQADPESFTDENLSKLAETVFALDEQNGLSDISYDKRLPDAWHATLAVKVAEDGESELSDEPKPVLDRSDIISRFGEAALDEVENPDGSINQQRLQQIMNLFGEREGEDTRKFDKNEAAVHGKTPNGE